MVSWFICTIWIGGMSPAYSLHRSEGQGRFTSFVDAIVWPGGLGRYIAVTFYRGW
jgi:hypothetical protein